MFDIYRINGYIFFFNPGITGLACLHLPQFQPFSHSFIYSLIHLFFVISLPLLLSSSLSPMSCSHSPSLAPFSFLPPFHSNNNYLMPTTNQMVRQQNEKCHPDPIHSGSILRAPVCQHCCGCLRHTMNQSNVMVPILVEPSKSWKEAMRIDRGIPEFRPGSPAGCGI